MNRAQMRVNPRFSDAIGMKRRSATRARGVHAGCSRVQAGQTSPATVAQTLLFCDGTVPVGVMRRALASGETPWRAVKRSDNTLQGRDGNEGDAEADE